MKTRKDAKEENKMDFSDQTLTVENKESFKHQRRGGYNLAWSEPGTEAIRMKIGNKVEVIVKGSFKGKEGTVTGFHAGVIPVGVTLDGDRHETDFKENELRMI